MFSGKTEELLRRLRRAKIAGLQVEIFKPSLDTRYDEEQVVSHDQNMIPSTPVDHSSNILLLGSDVDVVGIDEAQFLDDHLPQGVGAPAAAADAAEREAADLAVILFSFGHGVEPAENQPIGDAIG